MRVLLIIAAMAIGACASRAPRIGTHAPNPNGCYVMLFRGPAFTAQSDLLNGPGNWTRLDNLIDTHHRQWSNEIRSLRVGDHATVVAYKDRNYRGESARFTAGTEYPELPRQLAADIESLQIACSQ
jgi:hypothetical protein